MASYGLLPPAFSRTTPTRKTPAIDSSAYSPLSGFASPSSAASNPSFSPPSAAYLSLASAAATTPLSSVDSADIDRASTSSTATADNRDQHEPLLGDASSKKDYKETYDAVVISPRSNRSKNRQVAPLHSAHCPVDAAANTAIASTMAPIRGPVLNTRLARASVGNNKNNRATDTTVDAAPLRCETSALATNASSLYADASPACTTATSPWSPTQPITSDLIRRVSSSRSIAHSTTSPSSPILPTAAIVQPKATRLPSLHHQQPPSFRQPFSSSVAQLEETAEQFSRTGSIDVAIREAHQELKRSDSRRSSVLAAYVRQTESQTASRAASVSDRSDAYPADVTSLSRRSSLAQSRRAFSRQSSIIGLNSAARAGVFMPNDYIMSPPTSVTGVGRQRSASKASSVGSGSVVMVDRAHAGDDASALSRRGSVRSVQSGSQPLPGIVEFEPPMTITQDALDEADRRIANGDDDDDDAVRARAHQNFGDYAYSSSPDTDAELLTSQSPAPQARSSVTEYLGFSSAPQYSPVATTHPEYNPTGQTHTQDYAAGPASAEPVPAAEIARPSSAGSGGTYQQAQTAFHDFDGVHCDPDNASIKGPGGRGLHAPQRSLDAAHMMPGRDLHVPLAARPKSYLDPSTGQQMLFYPARVPAMLSLPPKLSKNPKAAERNARRSQVLSMMQMNSDPKPEQRESRSWLPDPVSGDMGSPFMNPMETGSAPGSRQGDESQSASKVSLANDGEGAADGNGDGDGDAAAADRSQLRRPARLRDLDKRKSRMAALNKLPPQLRASAFFDAPSLGAANLELKNGSATDTLESILDASANAPVSAFTDHAFAGHLGPEVYGTKKPRTKKKKAKAAGEKAQPGTDQPTLKPKSSFMSLVGLGHIRKTSDTVDSEGRPVRRPRRRLSKNFDGTVQSPELGDGGIMAPDDAEGGSDEEDDEDDEDDDDDEEDDDEEEDGSDKEGEDEDDVDFEGAPTTLLAELQLRKRQQKLRTRPINPALGGMRSTLLELDIVAEIERKARKGKKVNLAWEDPQHNGIEASDDEDVPLGLLYANKPGSMVDMMRPLGLMEKKEMEDNEPLSRRRDRLQGRDGGMFLRPSRSTNGLRQHNQLRTSPSMQLLNVHSNAQSVVAPEDGSPVLEEFDDEPLGVRRQRMKAKEESQLPRARPVSTAFSEELLGKFVDPEDEAAKEREKKEKAALPSEEEETLGQRRRRLQLEKEARQQEMHGLPVDAAPTPTPARLSRRLSMADVLAAHPLDSLHADHMAARAAQEREQQMAAAREQKMAAMRAQMPNSASYASASKSGGFLGGRFNDGSGGIAVRAPNQPYGQPMGYPSAPNLNRGMNNYGGYGGMAGMPAQHMPMPLGIGRPMPMQVPMPVPGQPQIERVERWRQSIQP